MTRIRAKLAIVTVLPLLAGRADARPSVGKLLDFLTVAPPERKPEVLHALGRTRKRKAVEPLLKMLDFSGPDPRLTASLVEALGDLGDERAVEPIRKGWNELQTSSGTAVDPGGIVVRAAAAEALGKLGGGGSMSILRAASTDPDPRIRLAAARGLGRLKDPAAVEMLLGLAGGNDEAARQAFESLGQRGNLRLKEQIAAKAEGKPADVRAAAAYALARFGDSKGLEALRTELTPSPAGPGLLAAAYLLRLERTEGLDYLVKIIADPGSPHRVAAAEALGLSENSRAAAPLMDALASPDPALRRAAAAALGKVGGERAWFVLHKARGDGDPSVRDAVRVALTDLADYAQ